MVNEIQSDQVCEVCGGLPPVGHRICDDCWPDQAVEVGRAAICTECDRPRLVEKLVELQEGSLVCREHEVGKS